MDYNVHVCMYVCKPHLLDQTPWLLSSLGTGMIGFSSILLEFKVQEKEFTETIALHKYQFNFSRQC